MNVLITRPERDTSELKARIEALGAAVLTASLIEIEFLPVDQTEIGRASGLIVTSRNALRAIAASEAFERARTVELFAVGPATAAMARSLGFTNVVEGPGTAEKLAASIAERLKGQRGEGARLVQLAGDHVAFEMAEALSRHGLSVAKIVAYRAVAAETLPDEVSAAVKRGAIDAVVLLSPRTAETWAKLVAQLPSEIDLTRIKHLCLSAKVAAALPAPLSSAALIAQSPEIGEIITLLYRLAGDNKNR